MLARMPEVDNLHRSRKVFGGQPPNPESSIPHDHYLARLGQTIHDRQRIERLAKVLGFAASGDIVLLAGVIDEDPWSQRRALSATGGCKDRSHFDFPIDIPCSPELLVFHRHTAPAHASRDPVQFDVEAFNVLLLGGAATVSSLRARGACSHSAATCFSSAHASPSPTGCIRLRACRADIPNGSNRLNVSAASSSVSEAHR